jgi:hypothetical protein
MSCRCAFALASCCGPFNCRASRLWRRRNPLFFDAIREDGLARALEAGVPDNLAAHYEAAYARKLYFSSRKELLDSGTSFDLAHDTALQTVVNMARRLHGENWQEVMLSRIAKAAPAPAAMPVCCGCVCVCDCWFKYYCGLYYRRPRRWSRRNSRRPR